MKFLVDSNLPPQMAAWLEASGHIATHVDDQLPGSAPDADIWALAKSNDAIIVTKDSDFRDRAERDRSVQVIWVRCGNLRLPAFRLWFERRLISALALIDQGEQVVELI